MDIKKAFESIPHDKLLDKLWFLGILGSFGYGSNLTCAKEDNVFLSMDVFPAFSCFVWSAPRKCPGPLAFLIYINDLPDVTSHILPFMFADDTKCLRSIYKANECDHLQADLDTLRLVCYTLVPTTSMEFP